MRHNARHKRLSKDVWRPVGEDKIKSFVEYRQLYSECSMLFFGDNGQGDLMCAERLTGMNASPEDVGGMVSAAFIHQVADPAEQLSELHFEDHQRAKEVRRSLFPDIESESEMKFK